jgi:hypothetical protein
MKIFKVNKIKRKPVLLLLCVLSILFVCGCQCEGSIGSKSNKGNSINVTTNAFDKK